MTLSIGVAVKTYLELDCKALLYQTLFGKQNHVVLAKLFINHNLLVQSKALPKLRGFVCNKRKALLYQTLFDKNQASALQGVLCARRGCLRNHGFAK